MSSSLTGFCGCIEIGMIEHSVKDENITWFVNFIAQATNWNVAHSMLRHNGI